jgi:hypothetical protein
MIAIITDNADSRAMVIMVSNTGNIVVRKNYFRDDRSKCKRP